MKNRTPRWKLLTGTALVIGGLATATAASAAPPESLYILTWEGGQIYGVDPDTGATTELGRTTVALGTASVEAVDDDTLAAVQFQGGAVLHRVAITTGATTSLPITVGGAAGTVFGCTGFDVSPTGTWTVACDSIAGSGTGIGTLDPLTGFLTPVGPATARYSALATDPLDGVLYGIAYDGARIFAIDRATGVGTPVADGNGEFGNTYWGADFDGDGTLWLSDGGNLLSTSRSAGWAVSPVGPVSPTASFYEGLTASAVEAPPVTTPPVTTPPVTTPPATEPPVTGEPTEPPVTAEPTAAPTPTLAPETPAPATTPPSGALAEGGTGADGGEELAVTGASPAPFVLAGLGMLALGFVVLLVPRRIRRA